MRYSKVNQITFSKKRCFSLLEGVVSMGLFSVSLLSIIQLQIKAQAVISDASLKNKALAYASSWHEIEYLESASLNSKNNKSNESEAMFQESASQLNKLWQTNIQSELPDVKIESQLTKDNQFSLTLIWTTRQISFGCQNSFAQERDCIQL